LPITLQEKIRMYAVFVATTGIGAPRAVIREATEVVEMDGITLVRDSLEDRLRPLAAFERLVPTLAEAQAAAADEIEGHARHFLTVAQKLRAGVAEGTTVGV
jgi:hypothetical protein